MQKTQDNHKETQNNYIETYNNYTETENIFKETKMMTKRFKTTTNTQNTQQQHKMLNELKQHGSLFHNTTRQLERLLPRTFRIYESKRSWNGPTWLPRHLVHSFTSSVWTQQTGRVSWLCGCRHVTVLTASTCSDQVLSKHSDSHTGMRETQRGGPVCSTNRTRTRCLRNILNV